MLNKAMSLMSHEVKGYVAVAFHYWYPEYIEVSIEHLNHDGLITQQKVGLWRVELDDAP